MTNHLVALYLLLSACTDSQDSNAIPILERRPLDTHACAIERPMTPIGGGDFQRIEALVAIPEGAVVAVDTQPDFQLAHIDLQGTLRNQVAVDTQSWDRPYASLAYGNDSVAVVYLHRDQMWQVDSLRFARYAANDLSLEVAPKVLLSGVTDTAFPIVVARPEGWAVTYVREDDSGTPRVELGFLAPNGDHDREPTVLANNASHASFIALANGDYAVIWARHGTGPGPSLGFAQLGRDGLVVRGPTELATSPEADDGWWSLPPYGHALVEIGATLYASLDSNEIIVVDGDTVSHQVLTTLPPDEDVAAVNLYRLADNLAVIWSQGRPNFPCGGCTSEYHLRFALLDPDTLVPVSAPIPESAPSLVNRNASVVAGMLLTAAQIQFHAGTAPVTGVYACQRK